MVPFLRGQRRHRIHGDEIVEVMKGLELLLTRYVKAEADLEEAVVAFRPFFRMLYHQTGRPNYPENITWNTIVEHLEWYHLTEKPRPVEMVPLPEVVA